MATPVSADDFVKLVRLSEVAEAPLLDSALKRLTPAERSGDAATASAALVREGVITEFQARQLMQGKSRGFFIGNYKVLERLGTGGMGLVYLCEHRLMKRRVAIKVLPNANAKDAESLKRFYREARVSAALDHPNIVRAYDVDEDDKHHYQVMEFVDGSLLHDIVVKHGPLDIHRAAHYISMVAQGLQQAHENNFVHRDIKPNNLILDRTGVVKILDMGLARIYSDYEEVLTRGILGTPDYLAPEQSVDSHHVDIRADIYSLGCTFFFLLTGKPPFEGTVAQKLHAHQSLPPPPIRTLRPDVPHEMAVVLEIMLAKDPAHRFQEPIEVVEALAPWTAVPIPPPSEEEMPRLSPAARNAGMPTISGAARGAVSVAARPAAAAIDARPSAPAARGPATRPPAARSPAGRPPAAPPLRTGPQTVPPPRHQEETPATSRTVPVPAPPPPPQRRSGLKPPVVEAPEEDFEPGPGLRPRRRRLAWLRAFVIWLLLLAIAVGGGLAVSWALFQP